MSFTFEAESAGHVLHFCPAVLKLQDKSAGQWTPWLRSKNWIFGDKNLILAFFRIWQLWQFFYKNRKPFGISKVLIPKISKVAAKISDFFGAICITADLYGMVQRGFC